MILISRYQELLLSLSPPLRHPLPFLFRQITNFYIHGAGERRTGGLVDPCMTKP